MKAKRQELLDALRAAIGAVVKGDLDGARYWISKAQVSEVDLRKSALSDGQEVLL